MGRTLPSESNRPRILDETVRESIIADPAAVLDDPDVMRALVKAKDLTRGQNIVDLRGLAMERLEERLDRLEDTHRHVIAAAYENLAGTNQIHRAVLKLMDATTFEGFLRGLGNEVAEILRIEGVKLILETCAEDASAEPVMAKLGDVLHIAPEGFVDDYIDRGKPAPPRNVLLRQVQPEDSKVFGADGHYLRSEACIRLNLGPGRTPGMLVLGSEDPHLFTPQQGTDLLSFFGGVFERVMRRWLN